MRVAPILSLRASWASFEPETDVHRVAGRRGEADRAGAADRALAGAAGELGDLQLGAGEAALERELADPRPVGLVDEGQVVGADDPGELRALHPAGEIGGDPDRAGELHVGDSAQRPEHLGRPVVADAAGERRGEQPGRPAAGAGTDRLEPELGPADDVRRRGG